ncbi:hypothetical protein P9477_23280 [Enterobacter mori]|uniref:portal protein n=1 Tax=Enterobacter mori TaxID=539813 RepID=UPI00398A71A3
MRIELTEDQKLQILPLIHSYYNNADDYMLVSFKNDAQLHYKYYHGRLPEPTSEGDVGIVDRTCYSQVQSALKDLIEVFCSGGNAVEFAPVDGKDAYAAKAATKLVNQVLLRDNDGYNVLSDAFLDALVTRSSFIKRYWAKETLTYPIHAKKIPSKDEVEQLIAGWVAGGLNIKDSDIEIIENEDNTFDINAFYTNTFEGVKVQYVPIEEILIDQQATSIQSAQYFCHRVKKYKHELLDLGLTWDQVETMPLVTMTLLDADYENVQQARSDYRRYWDQDIGENKDDEGSRVWVKEHYVRTAMIQPGKTPQLYQILETEGIIISCELISEIPFTAITPLPIPNQVFGESLVDLTKDIQDKLSYIQRAYINHANLAAAPRYIAIREAYDRRALLNNLPNSVVETDRPDALTVMELPNLSPGLGMLLQMVEGEAEKRTGLNDTQQGDVADIQQKSRQDSQSTQNMIELAQGKVRLMCRHLANGGVGELMKAIYRLIRENGELPVEVLTAQGLIQINPKQLPERQHMKTAIALTSQEKAKRVANLQAFTAYAMQTDPTFLSPLNKHYMLTEMAEYLGFENTADFVTPLEQYQPPQNPMDAAELENKQADTQLKQAQAGKFVNDAHVEVERLAFEQQKAADDGKREDAKLIFTQQQAADTTNLESNKVAVEAQKDANAHQRHLDAHAVDVYRAESEDRNKQAELMLKGALQNAPASASNAS